MFSCIVREGRKDFMIKYKKLIQSIFVVCRLGVRVFLRIHSKALRVAKMRARTCFALETSTFAIEDAEATQVSISFLML